MMRWAYRFTPVAPGEPGSWQVYEVGTERNIVCYAPSEPCAEALCQELVVNLNAAEAERKGSETAALHFKIESLRQVLGGNPPAVAPRYSDLLELLQEAHGSLDDTDPTPCWCKVWNQATFRFDIPDPGTCLGCRIRAALDLYAASHVSEKLESA
jgi:hypothetical protein